MPAMSFPDIAIWQVYSQLLRSVQIRIFWGYAVFGKVTKGMDVVKKIESVHTHTVGPFENVPKQDVVIQKVGKLTLGSSPVSCSIGPAQLG